MTRLLVSHDNKINHGKIYDQFLIIKKEREVSMSNIKILRQIREKKRKRNKIQVKIKIKRPP